MPKEKVQQQAALITDPAPDIEWRSFEIEEFLIEERGEGEPPLIKGYAAIFNKLSEPLLGGMFREIIAPGAFSKSLKGDVRALINHNPDLILGRTKANTLTLTEDERGLAIEIDPPDTTFARDLIVSIGRRDISQMSFAFSVEKGKEEWERKEEGPDIRTLLEVELFDVSPVTFPAYKATTVSVRSLEAYNAWRTTLEPTGPDPAIEIHRRRMQRLAV